MAGINEITMSGRKTSREEMIDVDDDNESASAIEPQQAAKRQKRNVVVKKEPSQQLTHAAAVLLEPKQEEYVVENQNGGSTIVPDRAVSLSSSPVAPTRKVLLKIGDQGGDDDDVMVVEPPAETLYAVAAAANGGGCGDDEIQMLGCKNQIRLPHLRQHCTEIPFVPLPTFYYSCPTGFIPKTFVEDEEYEGNIDVCDLCYCYICDKPAKECLRWSSTVQLTMYHNHCYATDKGPNANQWQQQRQLYKDNNLQRIAELEELGRPIVLIHAFSPTDPYAQPHFCSLTKCRACGWYSKTRQQEWIGLDMTCPADHSSDWCQACGRIASTKSLQLKSSCVRYKAKPTDIYLGSKRIPFRIKVHDPRKMEMFRDNWEQFERTSPEWTYDEATAEEEMFHHRFGTLPSLRMILGSIPVLEEKRIPLDGMHIGWNKGWVKKQLMKKVEENEICSEDWTYEEKENNPRDFNGPEAVRAEDTDAILVDKNARVLFQELLKFESIGFPPQKATLTDSKPQLVGGDIIAKWNKQERRGEFEVRIFFCKAAAIEGLHLLLGAWFDVFPFSLAKLVGNMRATTFAEDVRSFYWHTVPPFNPSKKEIEELTKSSKELMKEGVDTFNSEVGSSLAKLPLKSSLGDYARLGGICLSETSVASVLQRFLAEHLPDHIQSHDTKMTASWTGRASGVSANHRNMCSVRGGSFNYDFPRLSFEHYVRDEEVPIACENLKTDCKTIEENTKSNNSLLIHLENLGHNEAPYVEGLNVELLPFQRQTLQWALDRENIPGGLQRFLCFKLPVVEDKKNPNLYFNLLLGKLMTTKPRLVRGGMIADEMGLGKTVVSLALILQNPAPLVPESGNASTLACDGPENAIDSVGWDGEWQREEGQTPLKASIISRGTLVVCHVSLVSQWIDEARSKLKDPGLVYAYHGQNRKRDAMILAKNSIIVTTYATLAKDATYHAGKAAKNGEVEYCAPCEQIRWWRIICDESHSLKQDTLQTKAVMSLVGDHKWAVSGTPWNTSLSDLKNQLKFIGLEHVDPMFNEFQKTVIEPSQIYGRRGGRRRSYWGVSRKISNFMFLMRAVMIRHSQNQQYRGTSTTLMSLPPKTERSIMIEFEAGEKEEYAALEKRALDFYRLFKIQNRKDFSSHYLKLIQGLTPLRIACAGGRIPIDEEKSGKVAVSDILLEEMGEEPVMSGADDESDEESVKPKKGRRVKGKGKVAENEESVKPKKKKKVQVFSESSFQSKFTVLIEELKRIRNEEPDSKSLVFSQYISSLRFLQEELPKHGFQFRTLSGDMSLKQRAEALHAFQHDPPTTIFILSMRAGAVGINLTQANRVFLLEPAMNPSLEAQAIGRVHRLGQTRPVEIVRLLMKDSIDTRICKLVDKKYSRVRSVPSKKNANGTVDAKAKDGTGGKKGDTNEDDGTDASTDNNTDDDTQANDTGNGKSKEDASQKVKSSDDEKEGNGDDEDHDNNSDDDDDNDASDEFALPGRPAAAAAAINAAIVGSMRTDKATLMGEEFDFLFGLKD